MQPSKRFIRSVAIIALGSLVVACGGAAEAPAPEAAEPEVTPAAEPEAAPVVVEPEPEEPQAPPEPQLAGEIITSGEEFDWISVTDRNSPATYYWTLRVQNDTTQTLDITVRFEMLDANDRVVKAELKTVRLAPADARLIREESEMSYQEALRVEGFSSTYDWIIVSS